MAGPRFIRLMIHNMRKHARPAPSDTNQSVPHVPVMRDEVVRLLNPQQNEVSRLERELPIEAGCCPSLSCFAMDRDPEFLKHFERVRNETKGHLISLFGPFSQLPVLGEPHGLGPNTVDMILMDLGVSSMQLDNAQRGFGFKHSSRLDMRMNGNSTEDVTAEDIVNTLNSADLARIFKCYGEERYARRIANAICEHRTTLGPVRSGKQLNDIISSVTPRWSGTVKLPDDRSISTMNPSARVFQALRIFINDELNELCVGLELAERLLRPPSHSPTGRGGRLVVISFHSLEDRLVKWALSNTTGLRSNERDTHLPLAMQLASRTQTSTEGLVRRQRLLTQLALEQPAEEPQIRWAKCLGPITPSEQEVSENPRSRSAKLRFVEKA
ncbi:putative methyltransferase protein 15 [Fasciola gigantica]|uniref:Putative methyltransferase protein 15 n=1 Tax=Fasciola gigantica TaxID=46835 RepID=A0A504Z1I4_FASGI|nr:putative methyltransferase protein 15 [Fasciola gigantica]